MKKIVQKYITFTSQTEAENWFFKGLNKEKIAFHNRRFAYKNNPIQMQKFINSRGNGSTISREIEVKIGDKLALIGCSF